jgi:hypothetical protein
MTIINHGMWSRYTPDPYPQLPAGLMFCKRDSDGVDWYDYVHSGANFAPGSIVATVCDGKVITVHREYDRLFPQGAVVIELTNDSTEDPQATYGGQLYDAVSNILSPAPPPAAPPVPTKAELMVQLQAIAAQLGLTIS